MVVAIVTFIQSSGYLGFQNPQTPSNKTNNPPQAGASAELAYGWHSDSPHFSNNGIAWARTFDINFGPTDASYDKIFGAHDTAAKQKAYDYSTKEFDWVAGNSAYMNKTDNPSGQLYSLINNHFHLVSEIDISQGGLWLYLTNLLNTISQSDFENLFLHSPTDKPYCGIVGSPTQTIQSRYIPQWACSTKSVGLNFFNKAGMENDVVPYWTGTIIPALNDKFNNGKEKPADDYKANGIFTDSGVVNIENTNLGQFYDGGVPRDALEAQGQTTIDNDTRFQSWIDNYNSFLGLVKTAFTTAGYKIINNGAGWRDVSGLPDENIYAQSLDGTVGEHEFPLLEFTNNNYPANSDTTTREVIKQRLMKSKYNGEFPIAAHFYETADLYDSIPGAPNCGSQEMYQWYQISGLANYYLTQQHDTDTYFRNSGNGCGISTTYGDPISGFIYGPAKGGMGILPLGALAYNIGQPDSNDFAVIGNINSEYLNFNTGVATNATEPVFSRSYTTTDGRKNLVVLRTPKTGLLNYDQSGNGGSNYISQAKPYFTDQSLYNLAGSLQTPIDLGGNYCELFYDGGLLCGMTTAPIRRAEGDIFVHNPIVGSLDWSDFNNSKSASERITDAAISNKKTYVRFDPFNLPDDVFNSNFATRPASVRIEKDIDADSQVVIAYKDKLKLNPAESYNFDTNASFGPKMVSLDSSILTPFNAPAVITITSPQVGFITNKKILKNGGDCTDCKIVSSTGNTIVFEVTGFSSYSVIEDPNGGRGIDNNNNNNGGNPPAPDSGNPSGNPTTAPPKPGTTKGSSGSSSSSGSNLGIGSSPALDNTANGSLPDSQVAASQDVKVFVIVGTLLALIIGLIVGVLGFRRKMRLTLNDRAKASQAKSEEPKK